MSKNMIWQKPLVYFLPYNSDLMTVDWSSAGQHKGYSCDLKPEVKEWFKNEGIIYDFKWVWPTAANGGCRLTFFDEKHLILFKLKFNA